MLGSGEKKVKTEPGDYRVFYAKLRDAIEKGTPPPVTLEQAWRTMRALRLAEQSSRERRTLPWDAASK